MHMKLIIAGGRHFDDYDLLSNRLAFFLQHVEEPIEIVSGRCNTGVQTFTTDDGIKVCGADGLGERFAKENGYKVTPFPAEWLKHGRAAGPVRNRAMAEYGTHCIAFWDGFSAGTMGMITQATKAGLAVRVVPY